MGHTWKGVSMKLIYHLAQLAQSDKFQKYDYMAGNM
jgi:hypothetical protein